MMKKWLFLLFLSALLLSGKFYGPGKFSEEAFRRLMKQNWAREVFDLDSKEAVEVFGEEGGAIFL